MKPIRVLMADDHILVRAGFRALLQNLEGIQIIGEGSDGQEALRLIKAHRPDVALLDIAMPGLNGLEVAARVNKICPDVAVLILSMHANEEYVAQALQAGAAGYLVKNAAPSELEVAIRSAARGETYLSPAVSTRVIAEYLHRVGDSKDGQPTQTSEVLTARQREILQLIAEGHTNKEIAKMLNLSVKTVETHRTQLMDRLDIHDIPGLVRYAIRIGLVALDK